jgi:hypothetical protein
MEIYLPDTMNSAIWCDAHDRELRNVEDCSSWHEKQKKYKRCAECGEELGDRYFTYRDNYIQLHFFSDIDNAFCSMECAAKATMLEDLSNEEGK